MKFFYHGWGRYKYKVNTLYYLSQWHVLVGSINSNLEGYFVLSFIMTKVDNL
jgi:hypothetical protein